MGVHLHLFRRGAVYQWRRRLPAQSTETCILQLSLRTTDPQQARILARRLTAESDRMLGSIRQETLTPADASKWLRHVVTEEMARIRKDRALIFSDGGADAQADWAAATAWRMLATRGVNAELEDEDHRPAFTLTAPPTLNGRCDHQADNTRLMRLPGLAWRRGSKVMVEKGRESRRVLLNYS